VTSIVSGGTTKTSTSVSSACATILGCNIEDESTDTGVATCTRADNQRKKEATLTATPAIRTPDGVVARATSTSPSDCSPTDGPAIIYPKNPKDDSSVRRIREKLRAINIEVEDTHEARSDALGFTAFFWVENISSADMNSLRDMVDDVSAFQIFSNLAYEGIGGTYSGNYHRCKTSTTMSNGREMLPMAKRC